MDNITISEYDNIVCMGKVVGKYIVKFIPEEKPEPDEMEALLEGRKDRAENGTIPHESIDWD